MNESQPYDDKKVIPHGKLSGGQEGRLDPGRRIYTGGVEAVSYNEAIERMVKRQTGKLSKIKGGVDDNDQSLLISNQSNLKGKKSEKEKKFEMKELSKAPESFEDFEKFQKLQNSQETTESPQQETPLFSSTPKTPPVNPEYRRIQEYLSGRKMITVRLSETKLMIPAMDVIDDEYCLTILFPVGESMVFIPDPGSEVNLSVDGSEPVSCYFPGSKFSVPELKIMGLCFIKKPKE